MEYFDIDIMVDYLLKDRAQNSELKFIIAIDGTAASGKGTIARILAEKFNMKYFASSIFYRKLASICHARGVKEDEREKIIALSADAEMLRNYESDDLYDENITNLCSKISVIPEVRSNLKPLQRSLIDNNLRVILDGRDIGTVIAPDAHLKLFIDASLDERSKRRYNQLQKNNISCIMQDIFQNLKLRDDRDMNREISPLKVADGAYVIDNSGDTEQTIAQVLKIISL